MQGRLMLLDDLPKASQRSENWILLKWWRICPLKAEEDSESPRKLSLVITICQLTLGHEKLLGWPIWWVSCPS